LGLWSRRPDSYSLFAQALRPAELRYANVCIKIYQMDGIGKFRLGGAYPGDLYTPEKNGGQGWNRTTGLHWVSSLRSSKRKAPALPGLLVYSAVKTNACSENVVAAPPDVLCTDSKSRRKFGGHGVSIGLPIAPSVPSLAERCGICTCT